MHGVFFRAFKHLVVDRYGRDTWDDAVTATEIDPKVYLPVGTYPDDEAFALIEATVAETGTDRTALLEAFGRRVAEALFETYGDVVPDDWTALDVVDGAESIVHTTLRERNADLDPPRLSCSREDPDRVTVIYESERALCAVATGLIRGIGDRYGEDLAVTETACVYEGDTHCELVVTR